MSSFPPSRQRALVRASLAAAITLAAHPSSTRAGRVGLHSIHRSVLPVVALQGSGSPKPPPGKSGDAAYRLLGNAVLVDDEGHAVAPTQVFSKVSVADLLPVSRLGVLLPGEGEEDGRTDVAAARTFARVRVLAVDEAAGLSLLAIEGGVGAAEPVKPDEALHLGDQRFVFGFGAPGILPHLLRASVTAILPAPSSGEGAERYALDAPATLASDGGVLFDRSTGRVVGMTVLHLRNVHRVVFQHADFEYGPAGTAVAIPLEEIRSWVRSVLDPGAGADAGADEE